MVNWISKHISKITYLFLICIFAATLHGLPGNISPLDVQTGKVHMGTPPFETSMERGRYAHIVAMADYGTLNIDAFPFFVKPDIAWYNGHYYPAFPPGVAMVAVPFYIVGKLFNANQLFSYAVTPLFTILTAYVLVKIATQLGLSKNTGILSGLIYAVGSCAWSYTVNISAHPVSAFLIALAFSLALSIKTYDEEHNSKKYLLKLSSLWLVFGLNLFVDYPNLVIMLPIVIYGFLRAIISVKRWKEIDITIPIPMVYTFFSILLILGLFAAYNVHVYGKPIAFTNTYNLRRLDIQGIPYTEKTLSNSLFEQKSYTSRFDTSKSWEGAQILFTSTDRGLFFYFPVYILAIIGLLYAIVKKKAYGIIIFLCVVADVLIYGSFDDPWGGWGFGPRYLIVILPLLATLVGVAYEHIFKKNILGKLLVYFLTMYSIGVALLGALTTNAVPPSVEARFLNMKDNYFFNWDLLHDGLNSAFVYNQFFPNILTPFAYWLCLLFLLSFFIFFLLFFYRKN